MNISKHNSIAANSSTVVTKGLGIIIGAFGLLAFLVATAGAVPPKPPPPPSHIVHEVGSSGKLVTPMQKPPTPSQRAVPKPRIRDRHAAKRRRTSEYLRHSHRKSLTAAASDNQFYQWIYQGSSGSWNYWWAEFDEPFGPTWIIDGYWNNPTTGQLVRAGEYCEYFPDFSELGWTCYNG